MYKLLLIFIFQLLNCCFNYKIKKSRIKYGSYKNLYSYYDKLVAMYFLLSLKYWETIITTSLDNLFLVFGLRKSVWIILCKLWFSIWNNTSRCSIQSFYFCISLYIILNTWKNQCDIKNDMEYYVDVILY